jgi:UDP-N-acetylglucosamine acyltransferase
MHPPSRVHPTAVIDPTARLADDVRVGPFALIEGPVQVGPGCVIRPHAHLIGPMTLGAGNDVGSGVVLGDRPQHLKFDGSEGRVEVGDGNVFREHVTVNRGTAAPHGLTRVGSGNYFMAGSHVAHDCTVGDRCIFANGALIGGHCVIDDGVFLSGNVAVHQHMRVGRLALLSGVSSTTKDIPPFIIQQDYNRVVGVNVVGMRRAGLTGEQIGGVRQAYRIIFMQRQVMPMALAEVEARLGGIDTVAELVAFIRGSKRGINATRVRTDRPRDEAA